MPETGPCDAALTDAEILRLRELTECIGVSGGEGEVRRMVRRALPAGVGEVQVDALGNLIVMCPGQSARRLRVMVAAHLDEVGLMIVAVDEDGRLRFETVGGINESQLAGRAVWLGPERVPGVIGAAPPHLAESTETPPVLRPRDLRIDVGVDSRSEALALIRPGMAATIAAPFECAEGVVRGKALDDRLGVATLLGLLEHSFQDIDVLAVFTTQEEVGLRGATAAAHRLRPDLAIVLDCTPARDLPLADGSPNPFYNTRLGAGPALYTVDASTISDERLLRLAQSVADELHLPFQLRQPGGGSTDAGAIHRSQVGVPSLSISVPARNLHGSASTARVSDWLAQRALVNGLLQALTPQAWAGAGSS
jgi:tetrahedral aminopeptidase